jgi:hypothetical protein
MLPQMTTKRGAAAGSPEWDRDTVSDRFFYQFRCCNPMCMK